MNELHELIVNTAIGILTAEGSRAMTKFDLLRKIQRTTPELDWLDPNNLMMAIGESDQLTVDGNVISIIQQEEAEANNVPIPVPSARDMFPGQWNFYDQNDVHSFGDWSDKLFARYLSRNRSRHKEEARDLKDRVSQLCELEVPIDKVLVEEVWSEIERFNEGEEGENEERNRLQRGLTWGEWRTNEERITGHYDINGADCRLIYPAQGTTTIHEYRRRPGKMKWPILRVEQNETTYYLAVAPIKEIDAVCAVPDLPETITSQETAKRILDRSERLDEWQRQLNIKRREAIMQFMENHENIIANAPILFIADEENSTVSGNYLEISMNFLRQETITRDGVTDTVYRDVQVNHHDNRPLWLIDGQHRIRGGAGSTLGREVNVPIIIFPNELSLKKTAKIFAEINTLQEPLDNLHQRFMQHRFQIPSPKLKSDFGVDAHGNPRNAHSRANHWAYELAATLCKDQRSPLYGRIQLLTQNQGHGYVIDAKQWLDFSQSWMKSIYADGSGIEFDTMKEEVGNFFKAFRDITEQAYPTNPGWNSNPNRKSLIQRKSAFVALLLSYPAVRRRAKSIVAETDGYVNTNESINTGAFRLAMEPWRNVDWQDDALKQRFGGSGEPPRRSLLAWLECALGSEIAATRDEIHTDEFESVAGKGIFGKPAKGNIVRGNDEWIYTPGQQIEFYSERPLNALPTCRWELQDPDGNEILSRSISAAENRRSYIRFKHSTEWSTQSKLQLVAKWENENGTSTTRLILSRNG